MNYDETMNYIQNTAKFGSNLGLERTENILKLLGDPHKKIKFIHVAGTNGKGSTTAMISKILLKSGYKVGMYTSPYLIEFEERIQINERNIPKEDLCRVVSKVADAVEKVVSMGFDNPTEFEIITCAAFLYFYEENIDFGVIEVGLGGRLDSTNVINPILSVITSISYDHMQILGDTLSKIAYEKAGIVKEGVPCVIYPIDKEALEVIEKVCIERHSRVIYVPKDCSKLMETKKDNSGIQQIEVRTSKDVYDVELSLLGTYQILNCSLAIFAAEELQNQGINISKEDILQALKTIKWIGRLEIIKRQPLTVIDGAHNIDGIIRLEESIDMYFKYNRIILILGILADKQVDEMIKIIAHRAWKVFTVTPHSNRAEGAFELRNRVLFYNPNCEAVDNYEEAYNKAVSCYDDGDLILISGSLYMIGDMRKII